MSHLTEKEKSLKHYCPLAWAIGFTILLPALGAAYIYGSLKQQGMPEEAARSLTISLTVPVLVFAFICVIIAPIDDFAGKVVAVSWDSFSRCWKVRVDCYNDRRFFDEALSNEYLHAASFQEYNPRRRHKPHSISQPTFENASDTIAIRGTLRTVGIGDETTDRPIRPDDIVIYNHSAFGGRVLLVLGNARNTS